jgi:hypothetical protein
VFSLVLTWGAVARTQAAKEGTETAVEGENAIEPVHLDYQAPEECPNEEGFFSLILNYTQRATIADDSTPEARRFDIRIRKLDAGFLGELRIGQSTETPTRSFDGTTCSEVTDALAFASALALDPSILGGPVEEPQTEAPPPKPAETPPEKKPPRKQPPPPVSRAPAAAWSKRLLLGGQLLGHALPDIMLGPSVGLQLWTPNRSAGSVGFRLEGFGLFGPEHSSQNARVDYDLFGGTLGICLTLFTSNLVDGSVCAEGRAARLHSARRDASDQNTSVWMASDLAAHLDVPPFGPLALELGGGYGLSLRRQVFEVTPVDDAGQSGAPLPIHEVPLSYFTANAAIVIVLDE